MVWFSFTYRESVKPVSNDTVSLETLIPLPAPTFNVTASEVPPPVKPAQAVIVMTFTLLVMPMPRLSVASNNPDLVVRA